ncbi:NAD-dependent epimerase/dehydratase family protein [Steroidobacter flavus]|uniref:NAD-dependent epimerase/dehydratase family protein n=1 Tax=Steroidobacter flavus TaxID=1842136 RepID=A0ABV8T0L1_9GAMM
MIKRVLVTGATGFVGGTLCGQLAEAGFTVRAALRTEKNTPKAVSERVVVGDIGSRTDWQSALEGVDFVVHAAARAHVLNDSPANANLYMESNAHGTVRLADAAAAAGVQRLVFLSSVKVNGEDSGDGVYRPDDRPQPLDAYGRSKAKAEEGLREVCARTRLQGAIIRSPLVYGPGVRANFLRLLQWVDKRRPLPIGSVRNRRSMVSVWNLSHLLTHALSHPAAADGVWMVSDGQDVSTPELVRRLADAMGRRMTLLPVPVALLRIAGTLLGKGAEVKRLCGSLAVDASATRNQLGWTPALSLEEGLQRTVQWYLAEQGVHAG